MIGFTTPSRETAPRARDGGFVLVVLVVAWRLLRRPDQEHQGPRRVVHLLVRYSRLVARWRVLGRTVGEAAWRLPSEGRWGRSRIAGGLARYGERSLAVGLTLESQRAFELTVFLQPSEVRWYRRLAALQTERGKFEDAVATVEAGLSRHPTDTALHAQFGAILGEFGRWTDAILHLEQATAVPGAKPKWHRWLAHAYAEANRPDDAVALVERLLEESPRDPVIVASAAGILTSIGHHEESIAVYRRLARLEPGPRSQIRLARALRRSGHHDEAITEARRAISLDVEDSGSPWAALAHALRAAGRPDEAVEPLREAVARHDHHRWVIELADLLHRLQRRDESHAVLDRWLLDHPDHDRGARAIAGFYSRTMQMPEAISLARRLVETRGTARSHVLLADYHRKAGDHAAMFDELERAEWLDPTEATIYATRATGHNDLLQHEAVLADLRRALVADPDRDGWRMTLTDRLVSLDRVDEAWEVMQPLRHRIEEPGPIRDRFRRLQLLCGDTAAGHGLLDRETTNPSAVFTAFRDLVDGGLNDEAFAYLADRLPVIVATKLDEDRSTEW